MHQQHARANGRLCGLELCHRLLHEQLRREPALISTPPTSMQLAKWEERGKQPRASRVTSHGVLQGATKLLCSLVLSIRNEGVRA
eukprot:15439677-Alexandrium_andersonii.AAC.1